MEVSDAWVSRKLLLGGTKEELPAPVRVGETYREIHDPIRFHVRALWAIFLHKASDVSTTFKLTICLSICLALVFLYYVSDLKAVLMFVISLGARLFVLLVLLIVFVFKWKTGYLGGVWLDDDTEWHDWKENRIATGRLVAAVGTKFYEFCPLEYKQFGSMVQLLKIVGYAEHDYAMYPWTCLGMIDFIRDDWYNWRKTGKRAMTVSEYNSFGQIGLLFSWNRMNSSNNCYSDWDFLDFNYERKRR